MHVERGFWAVLVTGITFIALSESAVTDIPSPMKAGVNDTVRFRWKSDKKILEVVWGIRKGNPPSADPQYITVDDTEVPTINSGLDSSLKGRVGYNGSLAIGQAWFYLTNAIVNDSKEYIALIREEGSVTQVPYFVEVIVRPESTTTTSTAPTTAPHSNSSINSSSTSPPTSTTTPKPSDTPSPPHTPEGLSGGEIAAVVIGAFLGLVIAAIIGWLIYKYCIKKPQPGNLPADKKNDTELNSPSA